MINSCKSTRKINSFVHVSIPSPRDLFHRYGEREPQGLCMSELDNDDQDFVPVSRGSVIDDLINAQTIIENDITRSKKRDIKER